VNVSSVVSNSSTAWLAWAMSMPELRVRGHGMFDFAKLSSSNSKGAFTG